MDFIAIGVALVVGLALGAVIGQLKGKQALAGAVARTDYERVAEDKAVLVAKLESAQLRVGELVEKLEQETSRLMDARDNLQAEKAKAAANEQRLLEQKEELTRMQQQMELKFQNLSNQMLEQMGQKFSLQSEEKLGVLLTPMREKLKEFSELVTKSFGEQNMQQFSLKEQIEKIVLQTDGLTKALRGDVKVQGNWGEVMLERILEASGLRKGVGYTTQGSEMGLMDEEGNRKRPDVIIHLPDGKHIIVDSKVSLMDYDRYCEAQDDAARLAHLKGFTRSISQHVAGLSGQKYQHLKGLAAPDFVLLFMPIEGAFSLAVQHDPTLHASAWEKGIAIVSPSTLFISLRTIASLWSIDEQNKNTVAIAERGAALYDKFVGFVEDMLSLKKAIDATSERYDKAMNKLSTGTGNVVRQAEMMKQLGLKTTKALPKELVEQTVEALPLAVEG